MDGLDDYLKKKSTLFSQHHLGSHSTTTTHSFASFHDAGPPALFHSSHHSTPQTLPHMLPQHEVKKTTTTTTTSTYHPPPPVQPTLVKKETVVTVHEQHDHDHKAPMGGPI